MCLRISNFLSARQTFCLQLPQSPSIRVEGLLGGGELLLGLPPDLASQSTLILDPLLSALVDLRLLDVSDLLPDLALLLEVLFMLGQSLVSLFLYLFLYSLLFI